MEYFPNQQVIDPINFLLLYVGVQPGKSPTEGYRHLCNIWRLSRLNPKYLRWSWTLKITPKTCLFSLGDFAEGCIDMVIVGIGINVYITVNIDAVSYLDS